MRVLCIRIPVKNNEKYLISQELPVFNYYPGEAPKDCFLPSDTFLKGHRFCQYKTVGATIQKGFICLDLRGLT